MITNLGTKQVSANTIFGSIKFFDGAVSLKPQSAMALT
jgi:hypothetical protein